ncbi:SDR family NAD(P)-dependent oxidoreductase [Pseudoroseomonas wenyumeiae]
MGKVWLVTGASRGLGREITQAALDAGETVVATARSADAVRDACGGEHDRLHALALDITDAEAANSVAAETTERFGAIDVLVNNAGYAELGFFETFTDAAVRRQFEVNLFGTMNVARAVAPTCVSVAQASSSPSRRSAGWSPTAAGRSTRRRSSRSRDGWKALHRSWPCWASARSWSSRGCCAPTSWTGSRRASAASTFRTMPRRWRSIARSWTGPTVISRAIRSCSPRGS